MARHGAGDLARADLRWRLMEGLLLSRQQARAWSELDKVYGSCFGLGRSSTE